MKKNTGEHLLEANTDTKQGAQAESDLPQELSNPARRALVGAGYLRLEQLSQSRAARIKRLHSMGPKALEQLRHALAARGLSFADEESRPSS